MKTFFSLSFLLFACFSQSVYSQPAEVKLPSSISGQPGSLLQIPITVSNFDSICNISMVFTFDTTVMTYTNMYYNFPNIGMMDINRDKNQIRYGWFNLSPLSLDDNDTLLMLNFNYLGGNCSLNWDMSQGNCYIGNCQTGEKASSFINGNDIPLSLGEISGKLTYDNSVQSPLAQVQIVLKDNNDALVGTTTTDNEGNYSFPVNLTGTYHLTLSPPIAWNGVNSIDALNVIRHFAGVELLSGLALKAADVNNSNYVNSSDALLVLKRFIGLQSSFPAGDWVFDNQPVNMNTLAHQVINIKALFMGDVNQSFQP